MDITENDELIEQYRNRAAGIVSKMTLEEKVSQTLSWAKAIDRLGIKAYNWWNEGLHGVARAGVATVFPQAVTLAASFDEDLAEEVADAISTEARAKYNMQQHYDDTDIYKGLTYWAPNINIFRDPRWGRGHETYGEDPYLASRMGMRFVRGMQGHDKKYLKTAACAKHFAVHSGPESIRHEFNAEVDNRDLYETYLPAFKACVKEGRVEAVMGAYNRVNGVPCCGNKRLLIDILRKEWGFKGHVVSDCWAIKDFHEGHGVTSGPEESVAMAVNNGCDLNCGNLFAYLTKAVQDGLVDENRINEALTNLYTTRMKLGMFDKKEEDNPYDKIDYSVVDSAPMRALNLKAAQKSVILLKNEGGLLPLDRKKLRTVGVIGPNADNRKALVGNYEGTASRYITVLEGIEDLLGEETRVVYTEGCHLFNKKVQELSADNDRISEVKGICEESDVVIAVMGLDAGLEGEEGDQGNAFASGDKPDLELPGLQNEVLKTIYESGKPAVLVLMSGSALAINWAAEHIPAIIDGGYPGAQGGKAIAEVIFGEKNPEGRLPVTFYKTSSEIPDFTDYSMKGRTYRYMNGEALYPFGFGLSYTEYEYSDAKLSSDEIYGEKLTVSADIKNTGKMAGVETVEVYIKSPGPEAPNYQLKGIRKVALEAGETKKVEIELDAESFGVYDNECHKHIFAGDYEVYIGGSQPDLRSEKLAGRKVAVLKAHAARDIEI